MGRGGSVREGVSEDPRSPPTPPQSGRAQAVGKLSRFRPALFELAHHLKSMSGHPCRREGHRESGVWGGVGQEWEGHADISVVVSSQSLRPRRSRSLTTSTVSGACQNWRRR